MMAQRPALLGASLLGLHLLVMPAHDAAASGFALREGDADWMANAFAGQTAKAYNASTVYANPAGMVRLNSNEIAASINYIVPSAKFNGQNYLGPSTVVSGTQGNNVVEDAVTGAFAGVWSYSPDLKFGASAAVPYGQRVSNGGQFVGRYQSLVSSISDLNWNIAAAYRVTPQLSIGVGLAIDYFSARLTQAINTGRTAALTGDPTIDISGSNTSAGYNLGVLYQFNENVRAGFDYRSRITHGISGTQQVTVPPLLAQLSPRTAAVLNAANSPANTNITLPDSVTAGAYWQITPRWATMVDAQWTDWSLLNTINVVPTNGAPSSSLVEHWRNTYFASLGVSYLVTDKLLLQSGFGYDQSPVTTANRTTRIPDYSRWLMGVGLTYSVLPNLTVTASYLHLFGGQAAINGSAAPSAGVIVGNYKDSDNSAALGFTWKF